MRLIDADALIKDISELKNGLIDELSNYSADEWVECRDRFIILTELEDIKILKEIIEEAPTVERPRGEWVFDEERSKGHIEHIYLCSACKAWEAWGNTERYNFCPNCGADMRGEGE